MAQTVPIKLSKFDNQPWGFRIQGGKDFSTPITVQKVNGGSLAERAGLNAGDTILSINGIDALKLRHKEAQDTLVKAGNNFEIVVVRGNVWKPAVTPLAEPKIQQNGEQVLTKTSLASSQQPRNVIGNLFNSSPKPYPGRRRSGDKTNHLVNNNYLFSNMEINEKRYDSLDTNALLECTPGYRIQSKAHLERGIESQTPTVNGAPIHVYNSPVGLYSEESIAETLTAQAEVLSQGVLGVNFKKNERQYNAAQSEVLKMIQENDSCPKAPESTGTHCDSVESNFRHKGSHPTIVQSHAFRRLQSALSVEDKEEPPVHAMSSRPAGIRPVEYPKPKPKTDDHSGIAPDLTKCGDCDRLIVGVFVKIKDRNLHVECFKCATCGTSLKNVGYYNISGKLYCDIHARQAARHHPEQPEQAVATEASSPVPPSAVQLEKIRPRAQAAAQLQAAAAAAPAPAPTPAPAPEPVYHPAPSPVPVATPSVVRAPAFNQVLAPKATGQDRPLSGDYRAFIPRPVSPSVPVTSSPRIEPPHQVPTPSPSAGLKLVSTWSSPPDTSPAISRENSRDLTTEISLKPVQTPTFGSSTSPLMPRKNTDSLPRPFKSVGNTVDSSSTARMNSSDATPETVFKPVHIPTLLPSTSPMVPRKNTDSLPRPFKSVEITVSSSSTARKDSSDATPETSFKPVHTSTLFPSTSPMVPRKNTDSLPRPFKSVEITVSSSSTAGKNSSDAAPETDFKPVHTPTIQSTSPMVPRKNTDSLPRPFKPVEILVTSSATSGKDSSDEKQETGVKPVQTPILPSSVSPLAPRKNTDSLPRPFVPVGNSEKTEHSTWKSSSHQENSSNLASVVASTDMKSSSSPFTQVTSSLPRKNSSPETEESRVPSASSPGIQNDESQGEYEPWHDLLNMKVKGAGSGTGTRRIVECCMCKKTIKEGPFVTALGRNWCPEHFVCANDSCKRHLQEVGFVEEKNELYCESCFENYLAPVCDKCQKRVIGDCLKAIGKQFHPECFACAYCGRLFENSRFYLEDGLPYCEADWNELFTTKCFGCGFPIEAGDRWVEAMNNNYHSQCFNCSVCKKNLEGQSFLAKGGKPMCKSHAARV